MKSERRTMERFKLGIISRIRVAGKKQPNPEIIELVTRNICAGGAYFKTPNPLPEGTRVSLLMTVEVNNSSKSQKNMMSIEISGTVIRTEENGMAIRFENGYKMLPLTQKKRGKKS